MDIIAIVNWLKEKNQESNERRKAENEAMYSAGRDKGYAEGEQRGILTTLTALYEANVEDDEIIRVMNKVCNIPQRTVRDLLWTVESFSG